MRIVQFAGPNYIDQLKQITGSRGRIEFDPRMTMAKEAMIRGMLLLGATDAELKEIHAALCGGEKT